MDPTDGFLKKKVRLNTNKITFVTLGSPAFYAYWFIGILFWSGY